VAISIIFGQYPIMATKLLAKVVGNSVNCNLIGRLLADHGALFVRTLFSITFTM
jgi:hypothetical protein